MKKMLILLSAVAALCSACQKEISLEDPNSSPGGGGGGTTPTGLLTRFVIVAGGDSIMVDYGYDAAKRLTNFTYATTGGGNSSKRIVRNSAGTITQYISKGDDLLSSGIDSSITTLTYNAAQGRYKSSLTVIEVQGVEFRDSTEFTYDGSGNLTTKTAFLAAGSSPYQAYQKTEYTYASGNVTSEKYFSPNATGTGWDLDKTYNYAFDNKINPVKLGTEAILLLDAAFYFGIYVASYFGNNNIASLDYVDHTDPSFNYSFNSTYTYNNTNKPTGGTTVETPGPVTYTLRYYYN